MIETPVGLHRMRKEPLKTMKMEDIKIEFVDVCVVPATDAYSIFDFESDPGTPATPADAQQVSEVGSVGSSGGGSGSLSGETSAKPRKRAKLDHMTPEEKAQHRKMMNRISAQSARDRQKALMVRQDSTIKNLQASNETLTAKNQELTTVNEDLLNENRTLKEENHRLSSKVVELEAKLKAAAPNTRASTSSEEQMPLDLGMSLKSENDVNVCCGSPLEPAEGICRTTSEIDTHSAAMDVISWNGESGEALQGMADFQERGNGREQPLTELDQFNHSVAETIATQMANQKRSFGAAKIEAWLEEQKLVKRPVSSGSQQVISASRHTKLASLLNAPIVSKCPNSGNSSSLMGSTLATMLSLPVKEPATLKLPKLNFGPCNNNSSNGAMSRVPEFPPGTNLETFSVFKQPVYLLQDDEEDKHYLHETDLYDSWKSTSSLDVELFPELELI